MAFHDLHAWISSRVDVWSIFGYLNLFISTSYLLWAGYARGWSRSVWTLLVAGFVFGTGIGTLLIPSIMGALLGGAILYLTLRALLRFRPLAADLFSIYAILFIGIGRIGCLLSGCCFGIPTTLPWGISYSLGAPAHWLHFTTGLQPYLLDHSLSIHPVQFYETGLLLGIFLPLTLKLKDRLRDPRALLFGFLSLYFLTRVGLEPLRGMSNVWWSEVRVGSWSAFQLFLMGVSLLSASAAIWFNKSATAQVNPATPSGDPILQYPIAALLLLASLLFSDHFQRIQVLMLLVLLPMTLYYQLAPRFHRLSAYRPLPYLAGVLGPLFLLTSQAYFQGSHDQAIPLLKKSAWYYSINQHNGKLVRLGNKHLTQEQAEDIRSTLGQMDQEFVFDSTLHQKAMVDLETPRISYMLGGSHSGYTYQRTGCGGELYTETIRTSTLMASMERDRRISQRMSSYGALQIEFTDGSIQTNENDPESYHYTMVMYNTGLEREIIGAGLGVGLLFSNELLDVDELPLVPGFYLRLGPRELHLEAGLNDRYYLHPGFLNFHLSVGRKPTRGVGYQFGVGNNGLFPFSSTGFFLAVNNLDFGAHLKSDFTVSLIGEEMNGLGASVAFRFPRR